jgi:chromosome segregation ATPase
MNELKDLMVGLQDDIKDALIEDAIALKTELVKLENKAKELNDTIDLAKQELNNLLLELEDVETIKEELVETAKENIKLLTAFIRKLNKDMDKVNTDINDTRAKINKYINAIQVLNKLTN